MAKQYLDKQVVMIGDRRTMYDAYYDRLVATDEDDEFQAHPEEPEVSDDKTLAPAVWCPKCHNDSFKLSYGEWELKAHCPCGHVMTVYDG